LARSFAGRSIAFPTAWQGASTRSERDECRRAEGCFSMARFHISVYGAYALINSINSARQRMFRCAAHVALDAEPLLRRAV